MPNLNSGFLGVTPGAEHLEIAQRVSEFGVRPNGLDMVAFQTPMGAALDAGPTVTV